MTDIKVSTETAFAMTDLIEKYEKQGLYFNNFDQLIQHLADEKLRELETYTFKGLIEDIIAEKEGML